MKRYLLLLAVAFCRLYAHAQEQQIDSARTATVYVDAKASSNNTVMADELWRKADKLYKAKKYQAALDTIDKAIALAPDYADIIDFRYYALAKLSRFEEALATLERAHSLDMNMDQYLENKGNMLHELQQFDSALVYYQRAIAFNPHDERYYYNFMYILSDLKKYKKVKKIGIAYEAEYDNNEITDNRDEDRDDIFFYIALASQYTNDTPKALEYYSKAIAINPYNGYLSNRGLLYEEQKNFTLALADYNTMISLKPQDPAGYFSRARIYSDMDLDTKALADLLKARSLGKDDADLNNNLGNAYKAVKKNELALQAYKRVLALDPENRIVRNNLAILYREMGKDSLSQAEYGHAAVVAETKEIPYYNRAFDLQKANHPEQAIPYYDSALLYKPNFVEAINQLGLCYSEMDRDSMAIQVFGRAIRLQPAFYIPYVNRAASFKALKNFAAAEADYKKAYELHPKAIIVFYTLAKLYKDIGDIKKATAYFEQAEELGVDDLQFYVDYSAFLSQKNKNQQAIAVATTGIKKHPKSASLYDNRGGAYSSLDSFALAVRDYEKAIAIDPNNGSAYYNLGNVYLARGQNELAIIQYKRAVSTDNKVYPYYLNLANAYCNLKDTGHAFATFKKMIHLNPDCSEAYFNRGALYSDLNQMNLAIQDYDLALELLEKKGPCNHNLKGAVIEKDKSDILLKKAVIYQATARFEKAIQAYAAYLNFNITDASAYDNYGYCLLEADKIMDAKAAFERAYELDKTNPDIIVGLIAVHYLINNHQSLNKYKLALEALQPKLPRSPRLLDALELQGYSYTAKFKTIFNECFH